MATESGPNSIRRPHCGKLKLERGTESFCKGPNNIRSTCWGRVRGSGVMCFGQIRSPHWPLQLGDRNWEIYVSSNVRPTFCTASTLISTVWLSEECPLGTISNLILTRRGAPWGVPLGGDLGAVLGVYPRSLWGCSVGIRGSSFVATRLRTTTMTLQKNEPPHRHRNYCPHKQHYPRPPATS